MNLALHGFLLQVFVSILDFQHGSLLCSAGEPGYLDFDNLPETNFSCQGKVIGGYYADVEAGCQMFHVCTIGQKDEIMDIKFLCLNGTVFDQETRVCERVDEVDCSKSERFYNLNLELYGNNAVTLSLHENTEDEDGPSESVDDHQQRTTSARPTTTTTTSTTTSRPNKPSTTSAPSSFSHPTGYPQHYQPQPAFPQVHTSQSKSLYDDKNGGYHHQYIFHNGERNTNQATSYQLFSNQGVSSTTVQTPQLHQIRFSSTASPQIIRNEPSTVAPLFHATPSTIQTLLNSNGNSPALINPIFHNHGIASTTEQFSIHSNNPRETSEYRENLEQSRPLEAVQSTNKGKVSKLSISPVPTSESEPQRSTQTKVSQVSQPQRISGNFLPTPSTIETTIRSFYPTPRSSSKPTQSSQPVDDQVTQHIHVPPPVAIPQLKPHQITINLPPPADLQRIVQNPSSLLSTQSRVIVTAKASVSDESGRPLNTTQLVTIPLPTIPASYDDYKEGDESFDPFYRDVPKIRNSRRSAKKTGKSLRRKRALGESRSPSGPFVYDRHDGEEKLENDGTGEKIREGERFVVSEDVKDFQSIKESLMRFRDMLFSGEISDEAVHGVFGNSKSSMRKMEMLSGGTKSQISNERRYKDTNKEEDTLEDLETKASKHLQTRKQADGVEDDSEDEGESKLDAEEANVEIPLTSEAEEYVDTEEEAKNKSDGEDYSEKESEESDAVGSEEETQDERDYENAEESEERKSEESGEFDRTDDYEELPVDSATEKSIDDYAHTELAIDIDEKSVPNKSENIRSEPEKTKVDNAKHVENERVIDIVILDGDEYERKHAPEQETTESLTEGGTHSSTEVPVLSTTELDTESASDDSTKTADTTETTSETTESTKDSKEHEAHEHRSRDTGRKDEQVTSKGTTEQNEPKESTEPKASPKRKSSRIRARGQISSRKKQYRDDNGDIHSVIDDEHDGEKLSTTSPSVLHLGTSADQINSHIFDEPESQTSKEVDTRAVGQNDSDYVKSLQDSKGQDTKKDSRKGEANSYETLKKNPNNLEKHRDGLNEFEAKEKEAYPLDSTASTLTDRQEGNKKEDRVKEMEVFGETERSTETKNIETPSTEYSTEMMKDVMHSVEEKKYRKEVSSSSVEEYDAMGDGTTMATNGKETEEGSVEMHREKVVFHAVKKSSRYGKARKFEDPPKEVKAAEEEKDEKYTADDEKMQSHEHLTVKSIESMHSDDDPEYHDSTEASYESTRELSKEDDYKEFESPDDDDTSMERDTSLETTSKDEEDVDESIEVDKSTETNEDESTEGVLKFTDELPKTGDKEEDAETKKPSVSVENEAHDYVDDNYEPDNYKERKPSTEPSDLMDEKFDKAGVEHKMEMTKENSNADHAESTTLQQENLTEETTKPKEEVPEDSEREDVDSTTASTTSSSTTPTTSSTSTTTTTPTTTTTTTTTVRPTPPKLFKPIAARKSYNYIPPTTTPNTVIIKPRFGLYNPKPAKPQKSYNDLVPKPVIRKLPILLRKTTTTQPSTTTIDKDSEETETTIVPSSTTIEASRSEENVLEGKLEAKEEALIAKKQEDDSSKVRDDQVPNASEQKSPNKLENKVEETSRNKEIENFTPYPISRLSTLAATIETTLKDVGFITTETEKSTTQPTFTFVDVDVTHTTTPPATIVPSRSEYVESSTTKSLEDETSTIPSTKSQYQDVTEFGTTSETATSTESFVTSRVELDVTENTKFPETTTMRALKRKPWTTRKEGRFNCLEKEMYRFYGDTRDCRLFHYCSPGFTARQVLDFRFVCEEGTSFDEESQSCRHDVRNRECSNRPW